MQTLANVWALMFGFFPAWMQAGILAIIGVVAVILALKLVAFVLDCLPFA